MTLVGTSSPCRDCPGRELFGASSEAENLASLGKIRSNSERLVYYDILRRFLAIDLAVLSEVSREDGTKFVAFLLDSSVFAIVLVGDNSLLVDIIVALRLDRLDIFTRSNKNPLLLLLVNLRRVGEEDVKRVDNLATETAFLDSVLAFGFGIPIVVEVRTLLHAVVE